MGHNVAFHALCLDSNLPWVATKVKCDIGFHIAIFMNHVCNMWQVNMTYGHSQIIFWSFTYAFIQSSKNIFIIHFKILTSKVVNTYYDKKKPWFVVIFTLCMHVDMNKNVIDFISTIFLKCNLHIWSHDVHDDHPIT